MFEQIISRCQLLCVLVERRPSSPDSMSDFGHRLLLENNHLAQAVRDFSSCQYFDYYFIDFNFFLVFELESHFFSTPLEFAQRRARRQQISCL